MIEGKGNGGVLFALGAFIGMVIVETLIMTVVTVSSSGGLAIGAALILAGVVMAMLLPVMALAGQMLEDATDDQKACFVGGLFLGLSAASYALSSIIGKSLNKFLSYVGIFGSLSIPATGDIRTCLRA